MTSDERKIGVKIPPGIEEGMSLRFSGHGHSGTKGGPPGDLYVSIRVAPHQTITRSGNDLHMSIDIDAIDATLGIKANIKCLDGVEKLYISSGTQPGTKFQITGRGVPHIEGPGRGHLIITVNVKIQKKLTLHERTALEAYKKIMKYDA